MGPLQKIKKSWILGGIEPAKQLGKYEKVLKIYDEAIKLDSDDAQLIHEKENYLREIKSKKVEIVIGMSYSEVLNILGEPTSINTGAEVLSGSGPVLGNPDTIRQIYDTIFCYWDRPEATYELTFTAKKLTSISRIVPKNW